MISFNKQICCSTLAIAILQLFLGIPCNAFVKELGMADSGVAYPQSSTTARYNPSGIIDVGNRFDGAVGFFYLNGHVKIKNSLAPPFNQTASTTNSKWIPAAILGVSKAITPRLSFAFSTDAGLTSSKGTVKHGLNAFGRGSLRSESLIGVLVPTIAYRWGHHDFGMSAPLSISRISTDGVQNFKPFSIHPNHVTNKGYDWAQAFNLRFGWLYHVTDRFDVGVSYITKQLCGSHFKKYKGLIPLAGKFELQPELRAGAAYHFPKTSIATQYTYYFFEQCKTLSNPVNAPGKLGTSNGPGPGFKDVQTIGIGLDYQLFPHFQCRAGYLYVITPFIRRNNVVSTYLSPSLFVRQSVSVGFTQNYHGLDIDFACNYAFKHHVSSPPSPGLLGGTLSANGSTVLVLLGVSKKY